MISKFWNLPLRQKVTSIYIIANVLIFIVNIFLILAINNMSLELDMVYQDNRQLNVLSEALEDVQNSMTSYLDAKTTDALEEYYKNEQTFNNLVQELDTNVTERSFDRIERNIRSMCVNYLGTVRQAVEAKRGRNVEKYRVRYENATELYNYISNYIATLNQEQFKSNTENYGELSNNFHMFEKISIIAIFVVIIGNVIIIAVFVKRLMEPLAQLAGAAETIANGNMESVNVSVEYNDEIGVVTNAFNKMVISIREYIEKLRMSMEAERELKEKELTMETQIKDAQLKYLQAQINPHFLFNTLNAGAQLAMMEGAERTYEYVQTVADFFRYNVKKQDNPVTIGEEITLVDNYIQILNVRFSGDIHYEKQIDERLLGIEMPSMILQPIVENCVNHGIREMGDKGVISISLTRLNDMVCIAIKDNGKGMEQSMINDILNGTLVLGDNKKESNGIGMDNVIARMRMFTNYDEAVQIISEGKDMGTKFIVNIPFNISEE